MRLGRSGTVEQIRASGTSIPAPAHDVLLMHSPSIYDFRRRPLFPGPITYTVGESAEQFVIPPVGMLGIAD